MNNQIDEIVYRDENHVIIYLVGRQFSVETTDGSALKITKELLFPYFEKLRCDDEVTQVVAA